MRMVNEPYLYMALWRFLRPPTFRMTRRVALGVDAAVSGHGHEIASSKDAAHDVRPKRQRCRRVLADRREKMEIRSRVHGGCWNDSANLIEEMQEHERPLLPLRR